MIATEISGNPEVGVRVSSSPHVVWQYPAPIINFSNAKSPFRMLNNCILMHWYALLLWSGHPVRSGQVIRAGSRWGSRNYETAGSIFEHNRLYMQQQPVRHQGLRDRACANETTLTSRTSSLHGVHIGSQTGTASNEGERNQLPGTTNQLVDDRLGHVIVEMAVDGLCLTRSQLTNEETAVEGKGRQPTKSSMLIFGVLKNLGLQQNFPIG